MATEITPIELSRNGISGSFNVGSTEGTEVSTGTGAYIDVGGVDASKLALMVTSTGAASCKVEAGSYTAEGIGDYTITSTGALGYFAGPFETARFKDTDGYINIVGDTAASNNCYVQAILLP